MKGTDLALVGVAGLALWALFGKRSEGMEQSGGFAGPAIGATIQETPTSYPVQVKTASGSLRTVTIDSPKSGVEFINNQFGNIQSPGQTLIRQNTTFSDNQGNTYRTGSGQTVSRLADGQIKVLTVKPVEKKNSFFQKPIRTINGKRTRVY